MIVIFKKGDSTSNISAVTNKIIATLNLNFIKFDKSTNVMEATEIVSEASIDKTFSRYWQLLAPQQKQSVLSMLKTFVGEDAVNKNFITDYNKDIDEALEEYGRGEYIAHEEIEKKYLTADA